MGSHSDAGRDLTQTDGRGLLEFTAANTSPPPIPFLCAIHSIH